MFYIVLFSVLAGLLVVAGAVTMSRNRARLEDESTDEHHPDERARRKRKAQRAQSAAARRKRHT